MDNYSDNIEIFDAYLNQQLNQEERQEFEKRLESDSDFRNAFNDHQMLVSALQKASRKSNNDFGEALQKMTKEEMESVTGSSQVNSTGATSKKKPTKVISLAKVRNIFSIAAILVVIAGIGFHKYSENRTNAKICDAIFAAGFNPSPTVSRGLSQTDYETYVTAIEQIQSNRLDDAVKALEQLYADADWEMKIEYGTTLAYAYIKQHDLQKARSLINLLIKISKKVYGEPTPELLNLLNALQGTYFA